MLLFILKEEKTCLLTGFSVYYSKEEIKHYECRSNKGNHNDKDKYEVRPLKGQAIGIVRLLDPGISNRFFVAKYNR